jgi:trehalose 6-phosphate phosphatase
MTTPITAFHLSQLPPPPSRLDPQRWALFLDLDGTLVDLAARPDLIVVPEGLPQLLRSIADRHAGALAILSGRSRSDLSAHFGLHGFPAATLHGLERCDAQGRVRRAADHSALNGVRQQLSARSLDHPGMWVEDKGGAIALHYRQSPDLSETIAEFARELIAGHADLRLQPGDFVVEIKPDGADKGRALNAFLEEPPFIGRCPLMVGDDLTDEHAFAAAEVHRGFGVIVGARRPTLARFALDSPTRVIDWLRQLQDHGNHKDQP